MQQERGRRRLGLRLLCVTSREKRGESVDAQAARDVEPGAGCPLAAIGVFMRLAGSPGLGRAAACRSQQRSRRRRTLLAVRGNTGQAEVAADQCDVRMRPPRNSIKL